MQELSGGRRSLLNAGDFLHLLEIAVMLISIGVAYEKFDESTKQVTIHTEQLNRVEHYLSSKDPEYWRRAKEIQ